MFVCFIAYKTNEQNTKIATVKQTQLRCLSCFMSAQEQSLSPISIISIVLVLSQGTVLRALAHAQIDRIKTLPFKRIFEGKRVIGIAIVAASM